MIIGLILCRGFEGRFRRVGRGFEEGVMWGVEVYIYFKTK